MIVNDNIVTGSRNKLYIITGTPIRVEVLCLVAHVFCNTICKQARINAIVCDR